MSLFGLGVLVFVALHSCLCVAQNSSSPGSCVSLGQESLSLCFPYVSGYADRIYQPVDANAAGSFNTILQQFCQLLFEPNYRSYYWAVSCALAFPRCSDTGGALRLCLQDCYAKLPQYTCDNWMPTTASAQCTPINYFSSATAAAPLWTLLAVMIAIATLIVMD